MTERENCVIVNDIVVVMDNSGSMGQLGDEPNNALNSFIEQQKNALSDDATFTLWGFNHRISLKIDDFPLKELNTIEKMMTNGMTALFDAIGNAINTKLTKTRTDNVIFVIITDGLENSSKQFNKDQIQKLIKIVEEKHHWKFVYVGANQDALAVGENMGVYRNCCVQFDPKYGELSRAVSYSIAAYQYASSQGIHESDFTISPSGSEPPPLVRQRYVSPDIDLSPLPPLVRQTSSV